MIEVLKQALEALEECRRDPRLKYEHPTLDKAITSLRQAIAELESQEPVAWLLTEKNINSLQVDSIQLLIDRLKHAHHTDLCVRINGQDEWFQADWLKHMVRANPPQRTWVGLTDEEVNNAIKEKNITPLFTYRMIARAIEAKLKERNI